MWLIFKEKEIFRRLNNSEVSLQRNEDTARSTRRSCSQGDSWAPQFIKLSDNAKGESYDGRIQQPHMKEILGQLQYSSGDTYIQYVHRKSHSMRLGPKEGGGGGWMLANKV